MYIIALCTSFLIGVIHHAFNKGFKNFIETRSQLAAQYGPIYEMWLFGQNSLVISGFFYYFIL